MTPPNPQGNEELKPYRSGKHSNCWKEIENLKAQLESMKAIGAEEGLRTSRFIEEHCQALNRIHCLKDNLAAEQKHSDELAEAAGKAMDLLHRMGPTIILVEDENPFDTLLHILENHRSRRGGK